jgi:hypothetical protein
MTLDAKLRWKPHVKKKRKNSNWNTEFEAEIINVGSDINICSVSCKIWGSHGRDFWDVTPCGSCKNRRFGEYKGYWYWYFFVAFVGC